MVDFTASLEKGMREFTTSGAFLTALGSGGTNTMTVSWGFIGFMWNKPHFIAVVRPQRYTKEILDGGAESFTVSIPFDGKMKAELNEAGTKSGRDVDKGKIVRYVPSKMVDSPVIDGCSLYYECAIHTAQQFDGKLIAEHIAKQFYNDDYHFMYFGEIVAAYSQV